MKTHITVSKVQHGLYSSDAQKMVPLAIRVLVMMSYPNAEIIVEVGEEDKVTVEGIEESVAL